MQRLVAMQKEKRKISPQELKKVPFGKKTEGDIEFSYYESIIWNEIQAKYNLELSRLSAGNNNCQ